MDRPVRWLVVVPSARLREVGNASVREQEVGQQERHSSLMELLNVL